MEILYCRCFSSYFKCRFFGHFDLLIDVKNKHVIDNITGLFRYGRISIVNHFTICTTTPNSIYQRLLAEFPKLTRFMAVSIIKNHGVKHYILRGPTDIFLLLEDCLLSN